MTTRQHNGSKQTLRSVLSSNYQLLLQQHPLALSRFPHPTYGISPSTPSFPPSYKRYFFKLVKNIIISKGKKAINKKPVSLLITNGNRQSGIKDGILCKSMNTRL